MIVARAHPQAPTDEGWRGRVRAVAERGARAVASRSIAALSEREGTPAPRCSCSCRAATRPRPRAPPTPCCARWKRASPATRSRSGAAASPTTRASCRAPPARRCSRRTSPRARPSGAALAFEETGAYRLLLSAMSENPAELQRFYAETVEPLVAYDEQYETDLVRTLETFLEADGNVAGTAQRLFTHRHTIYYRLERVRELSGLDVSSSDGREKLSLGPEVDARARHRLAGRPRLRGGCRRRPRAAPRRAALLARSEVADAELHRVGRAASGRRAARRAAPGFDADAGVAVVAREDDRAVRAARPSIRRRCARGSRTNRVPQAMFCPTAKPAECAG